MKFKWKWSFIWTSASPRACQTIPVQALSCLVMKRAREPGCAWTILMRKDVHVNLRKYLSTTSFLNERKYIFIISMSDKSCKKLHIWQWTSHYRTIFSMDVLNSICRFWKIMYLWKTQPSQVNISSSIKSKSFSNKVMFLLLKSYFLDVFSLKINLFTIFFHPENFIPFQNWK